MKHPTKWEEVVPTCHFSREGEHPTRWEEMLLETRPDSFSGLVEVRESICQ